MAGIGAGDRAGPWQRTSKQAGECIAISRHPATHSGVKRGPPRGRLSYWWVLPPSLQPRGHRRASPLGLLLKSLMSPNQSPRAGAGSGAADEVSFPQQSVGNGKQMAAARRAHSWHLRSYAGRATGGQGDFLEGPGLGQAGPRTVVTTRSPREPCQNSQAPGETLHPRPLACFLR